MVVNEYLPPPFLSYFLLEISDRLKGFLREVTNAWESYRGSGEKENTWMVVLLLVQSTYKG